MTISENDLAELLERFHMVFETSQERLAEDDVPDDRIPSTYGHLASDAFNIGIYKLLLGNVDDAYSWLEESVRCYLQKVRAARDRYDILERSYQENKPLVLEKTLETALCAQDDAVLEDVLAEADILNPAYPEEFPDNSPRYYYVKALAALVRGNDATTREFLDRLHSDIGVMGDGVDAWYEAHALVLDGLLDQNHEQTRTGLKQLLEIHETHFQTPRGGDKLVCRPAVAFMLVARDRGFDIEFESEYVPECMMA